MMIFFIAAWVAVLWLLVSFGVFHNWHRWMQVSPAIIWVVLGLLIFLPIAWITPTGPVLVFARSIQISSSVSGVVTDVKPKGGAPLKKGDVLFTLDQTTFQSAFDQVNARLELAKERLGQKSQLFAKGAGKQVAVEHAQAEVDRMTAELEGANWNLEQTIIRAPGDGFVSNVVLPIGARVTANDPVMPFFSKKKKLLVS